MSVLYKIVEGADEKFQNSPNIEPEIYEQCYRNQFMTQVWKTYS